MTKEMQAKLLRLRALRLSQATRLSHEADRRAMLSREWERKGASYEDWRNALTLQEAA